MKANEFVKNKGPKTAKLIVDCWIDYPETDVYLPDMMEYTFIAIEPTENCPFVSLNDLKRLVESHELVEWHGGLKYAKSYFKRNSKEYPNAKGWDKLAEAIADVESCMEVKGDSGI